jgi:hypothetical protein
MACYPRCDIIAFSHCRISRMTRAASVGAVVLGWVVTMAGCVITAGALTAMYFLFVKGVEPGQRMFGDLVAPPVEGVSLHLANGVVLMVAPFIVRRVVRRWRDARVKAPGDE